MAVALRGNLQDFGIAEVFQLIGHQRKTGLLTISNEGKEVTLAFDGGAVVWAAPAAKSENETLGRRLIRSGYLTSRSLSTMNAEAKSSGRPLRSLVVASGAATEEDLEAVDSLLTRDTIFEVLRWTNGSFHFHSKPVVHDRPPERLLGAEQILMDGLRMVDEWQIFRDSVPPLDTIVEHAGDIDERRQAMRREGGQRAEQFEKIVQLIDGRMTLQRVIDLARVGMYDATRIIAELMDAGLVVPLADQKARVARRGAKRGLTMAQRLVRVTSVVAPTLLLCGMVYVVQLLSAARPERIEAFPIVRDRIVEAQTLFEKRRIRHAVEAHRYLTGEWPEALDQLEQSGLLPEDELAARSRAAYYYAPSENNVVLLAPER